MPEATIYTIGYGARDMESFVSLLKAHDIGYLLDVRSRPYSSYKPEFSQEALAATLAEHDIQYVFMGDTLGGRPDDPDCYRDGKVLYKKVARKPFYHEGIARLQEASRRQIAVVLMCSEGKPEQCHRSKLIGRTLDDDGIPVLHIDENDRLITQHDVWLRYNKGQPSLFGDDFRQLTSRKRYRQGQDDD